MSREEREIAKLHHIYEMERARAEERQRKL